MDPTRSVLRIFLIFYILGEPKPKPKSELGQTWVKIVLIKAKVNPPVLVKGYLLYLFYQGMKK